MLLIVVSLRYLSIEVLLQKGSDEVQKSTTEKNTNLYLYMFRFLFG